MRFDPRIAEEAGFGLIRFRQAKRAGAGYFNPMRREQGRDFTELPRIMGSNDNLLAA
jgi:hypothetical protein